MRNYVFFISHIKLLKLFFSFQIKQRNKDYLKELNEYQTNYHPIFNDKLFHHPYQCDQFSAFIFFFFKKRLTICHLVCFLGQCNSFRSTSQNIQNLWMKERPRPGSPSSSRHSSVNLAGILLPPSKEMIAQRRDKPPKFSSVNLARNQLRVIGNGKIVSVASWTGEKEALLQSYMHVFMKISPDLFKMRLTADEAEKRHLRYDFRL